jgi:hypothetical protein
MLSQSILQLLRLVQILDFAETVVVFFVANLLSDPIDAPTSSPFGLVDLRTRAVNLLAVNLLRPCST